MTGGARPLDPRDYVYIRLDTKEGCNGKSSDHATIRTHTQAARLDGFVVHSRWAVSERVGASVAASGRSKLQQLIRQLQPSDAVIVYTLDGFGRDASDVLKTIRHIDEMQAEAFCVSLTRDNLYSDTKFMTMMETVAALERLTESERKQARATGRGVAGGRIGRPPSLDDATQAAVLADLETGMTISAVARRYNTSHQTILRIRGARTRS
ncbi:recombinase family protein [Tritonibacter scottomollicae]|uniref:recombinase family protein n=1 Tax=Tritonibacter scottomollicae TaxID=483013 RepID=UPI000D082508|nr:recombinase family protein [Tritonibacter scottomollicae]